MIVLTINKSLIYYMKVFYKEYHSFIRYLILYVLEYNHSFVNVIQKLIKDKRLRINYIN
jgi:hypothetical protein